MNEEKVEDDTYDGDAYIDDDTYTSPPIQSLSMQPAWLTQARPDDTVADIRAIAYNPSPSHGAAPHAIATRSHNSSYMHVARLRPMSAAEHLTRLLETSPVRQHQYTSVEHKKLRPASATFTHAQHPMRTSQKQNVTWAIPHAHAQTQTQIQIDPPSDSASPPAPAPAPVSASAAAAHLIATLSRTQSQPLLRMNHKYDKMMQQLTKVYGMKQTKTTSKPARMQSPLQSQSLSQSQSQSQAHLHAHSSQHSSNDAVSFSSKPLHPHSKTSIAWSGSSAPISGAASTAAPAPAPASASAPVPSLDPREEQLLDQLFYR